MTLQSYENKVLLAIEALQNNPKLSLRAAAEIYEVNRMTLTRHRAGQPAQRDIQPNSIKLTKSEEEAII